MIEKTLEDYEIKKKYYSNDSLQKRLNRNSLVKNNEFSTVPCIEYGGYVNRDGYGQIYVYNRQEYAHKLSYCLEKNLLIEDLPYKDELEQKIQVIHGRGCSKLCIEPSHLSLGVMRDERDRSMIRGENHTNSKITTLQAIEIKHSKGEGTQKERAERFGVSPCIVNQIDSGHIVSLSALNMHAIFQKNETERQHTRYKKRQDAQKNKNREFSDTDWDDALERLRNKSIEVPCNNDHVTTPCHIFQGSFVNKRYGQLSFRGSQFISHILAFQAKNKNKNISNKVIMHLCGNTKCCNPEHLEQKS